MYNNSMSYMSPEEMKKETKMMSAADKKMYGDYETKMMAEHDVETLAEAGEIRMDKPRLKKAVHCAKMKKKYLDAVV